MLSGQRSQRNARTGKRLEHVRYANYQIAGSTTPQGFTRSAFQQGSNLDKAEARRDV